MTGLQLYVEEKLDSYRLEHPDLSEEEIHSKLQRKYAKLSDKKTVSSVTNILWSFTGFTLSFCGSLNPSTFEPPRGKTNNVFSKQV